MFTHVRHSQLFLVPSLHQHITVKLHGSLLPSTPNDCEREFPILDVYVVRWLLVTVSAQEDESALTFQG